MALHHRGLLGMVLLALICGLFLLLGAAQRGYSHAGAGTGMQGFVGPTRTSGGMLVPTGVSGISMQPIGSGWSDLTLGVYGSAEGEGGYGVYGTATMTGTAGFADSATS